MIEQKIECSKCGTREVRIKQKRHRRKYPKLDNYCKHCIENFYNRKILSSKRRHRRWKKFSNTCSKCNKSFVDSGKRPHRQKYPEIVGWCRSCRKKFYMNILDKSGYREKRRLDLKMSVFSRYGGAFCSCCGENHEKFLSIDHINNDGRRHKKEKFGGYYKLYRYLQVNNFPVGYRVLCHNCNMGRFLNGGICPHQINLRTAFKLGEAANAAFDMERGEPEDIGKSPSSKGSS